MPEKNNILFNLRFIGIFIILMKTKLVTKFYFFCL